MERKTVQETPAVKKWKRQTNYGRNLTEQSAFAILRKYTVSEVKKIQAYMQYFVDNSIGDKTFISERANEVNIIKRYLASLHVRA